MVKGIWGLLIREWRLDVFRTFVQTASSCWSVGLYNQEGSQLFANADICSQVNHSQSHHQIISLGFVFKTTKWYHSGEISSITNILSGLHFGWMSEGKQHNQLIFRVSQHPKISQGSTNSIVRGAAQQLWKLSTLWWFPQTNPTHPPLFSRGFRYSQVLRNHSHGRRRKYSPDIFDRKNPRVLNVHSHRRQQLIVDSI